MEITETKEGSILVLKLKGKLDSTAAPLFHDRINQSLKSGEKLFALDCSEMNYVSSAGVRALLLVTKQLRDIGGNIVLFALPQFVRDLFDVTGFGNVIPVAPEHADALAALRT